MGWAAAAAWAGSTAGFGWLRTARKKLRRHCTQARKGARRGKSALEKREGRREKAKKKKQRLKGARAWEMGVIGTALGGWTGRAEGTLLRTVCTLLPKSLNTVPERTSVVASVALAPRTAGADPALSGSGRMGRLEACLGFGQVEFR